MRYGMSSLSGNAVVLVRWLRFYLRIGGILGLLSGRIAFAPDPDVSIPLRIGILVIASGNGLFLLGMARVRVTLSPEGIRITNTVRSTFVPWSLFEGFRSGRRWTHHRNVELGYVRTTDGREIVCEALVGKGARGKAELQHLLDQLEHRSAGIRPGPTT